MRKWNTTEMKEKHHFSIKETVTAGEDDMTVTEVLFFRVCNLSLSLSLTHDQMGVTVVLGVVHHYICVFNAATSSSIHTAKNEQRTAMRWCRYRLWKHTHLNTHVHLLSSHRWGCANHRSKNHSTERRESFQHSLHPPHVHDPSYQADRTSSYYTHVHRFSVLLTPLLSSVMWVKYINTQHYTGITYVKTGTDPSSHLQTFSSCLSVSPTQKYPRPTVCKCSQR